MSYLQPTRITIESTLKIFSLDKGASDGSTLTIEFNLPEGALSADLSVKRAILEEKEVIDLLVLTMEKAKGVMSDALFLARKAMLKKSYDALLRRSPDVADSPIS